MPQPGALACAGTGALTTVGARVKEFARELGLVYDHLIERNLDARRVEGFAGRASRTVSHGQVVIRLLPAHQLEVDG